MSMPYNDNETERFKSAYISSLEWFECNTHNYSEYISISDE